MKECTSFEALLDPFVDGALSPEEMARVQSHLDQTDGEQLSHEAGPAGAVDEDLAAVHDPLDEGLRAVLVYGDDGRPAGVDDPVELAFQLTHQRPPRSPRPSSSP